MLTEYPQIFVSWSSPDSAIVKPFIKRLYAFGLNVKEYGEGMEGGEAIPATVRKWIKESKIAVIFYSDETATREWITTEVAWCVSALEERTLKKIIGVHVGEQSHPPKMPMMLRAESLNVRQLDEDVADHAFSGEESPAFELARTIASYSGIDRVQVLPALVLSMTRQRADDVFSIPDLAVDNTLMTPQGVVVEKIRFADYLRDLCRTLGMGKPPRLLARLKERYGATAQDLRPFENGQTVTELVQDRLREVNTKRREAKRPPLFVRWINDDLWSADKKVADEAARLWRTQESLLIIDSLSTWAPEVRKTLDRITDFGRSSVLWLPPYTQQLGSLDQALDSALGILHRIRTEFDADDDPNRAITRDAMSSWAMKRWLHRVFQSVADGPRPSGSAIFEMQQATDAPSINPTVMFNQ
jgi:hypothetical protein